MDYKKSKAAITTITRDKNKIDGPTGNIYESVVIIAKRTNQISSDIKKELINKLEEFASNTDSLDEVFENNEQIEVSRYYERLPKAHSIAVEEWLDDKIYFRSTSDTDKK